MTYAEKIKQSRKTLLMTQGELATELGVNSITVCRWETGKTEPSIKVDLDGKKKNQPGE